MLPQAKLNPHSHFFALGVLRSEEGLCPYAAAAIAALLPQFSVRLCSQRKLLSQPSLIANYHSSGRRVVIWVIVPI